MQSELQHELYGGSTASQSPLRLEQGYSRSFVSPYEQQPSEYGAMSQERSLERMGSPMQESPYSAMMPGRSLENMGSSLGGPLQPGYQGGSVGSYGNSPLMQLARVYGSQPLPASIPGKTTR